MQQKIFLIRHGEPIGGKRYRGDKIDDPLSSLGWEQMRNHSQYLENFSLIISSPMQRCLTFAKEFAEKQQTPLYIEPGLREIGLGHWEGYSHQDIMEKFPQEWLASKYNPFNRPEGGEGLEDFHHRVIKAYYQHIAEQKKVFIVTHSGVMRVIMLHLLKAPLSSWYSLHVPYAGIIEIEEDAQGYIRLTWHNHT